LVVDGDDEPFSLREAFGADGAGGADEVAGS
jgi:hypothetical protein